MHATEHRVSHQESLWKIADRYYNDPTQWPKIFAYNNQPDIVAKTGTRILDPDLILIGQRLYIPDASTSVDSDAIKDEISKKREQHCRRDSRNFEQVRRLRQCQPPAYGGEPMAQAPAKRIASPAYEIDLGQSQIATLPGKGFSIHLNVSGKLLIQNTQKSRIDITAKGLSSFEMRAKQEAETVAGKLIQDAKIEFDPKTQSASFSGGLTTQSNLPNAPSVGLEAGVNAVGQPILKGSVQYATVEGELDNHHFLGEDIGIEIEIVLDKDFERSNPEDASSIWEDLVSTVGSVILVVGAVVVVVGTLILDAITLGGSLADDPASFMIAIGMMVAARQLFKHGGVRLLQRFSASILTIGSFSLAPSMVTAEDGLLLTHPF